MKIKKWLNEDDCAYVHVDLWKCIEGQIDGTITIHEQDTVLLSVDCFSERGIEQSIEKLDTLCATLREVRDYLRDEYY